MEGHLRFYLRGRPIPRRNSLLAQRRQLHNRAQRHRLHNRVQRQPLVQRRRLLPRQLPISLAHKFTCFR